VLRAEPNKPLERKLRVGTEIYIPVQDLSALTTQYTECDAYRGV